VNSRPTKAAKYTGRRRLRSVWAISTKGYEGGHYATFPPDLPEIAIRAGTSEHGVCPHCGAPWRRIAKKARANGRRSGNRERKYDHIDGREGKAHSVPYEAQATITLGWEPGCKCEENTPVPAVVLDPFLGTGTTIQVANILGRDGIGCELKDDYARNLAMNRVSLADSLFDRQHLELTEASQLTMAVD
jgi:site-specific DNA-methyltransferase (adenine-specific)